MRDNPKFNRWQYQQIQESSQGTPAHGAVPDPGKCLIGGGQQEKAVDEYKAVRHIGRGMKAVGQVIQGRDAAAGQEEQKKHQFQKAFPGGNGLAGQIQRKQQHRKHAAVKIRYIIIGRKPGSMCTGKMGVQ